MVYEGIQNSMKYSNGRLSVGIIPINVKIIH